MTNAAVEKVIQDRQATLAAADEILRSEAQGAVLTGAEIQVLIAAGIDTKDEHQKQLARVARVMRWQEEAGTQADRDKLEKEIAKASKARDAKLPELRKELEETIQRLEGEIAALNDAVELPTAKLDRMCQACDHLRTDRIIPPWLIQEIHVRRGKVKDDFHAVTQAESDIKGIEGRLAILKKPNESDRAFVDLVHQLGLTTKVEGRQVLDEHKRRTVIDSYEKELAEKQAIVAEGKPQYEAALAEVESIRNHYVQ